MLLYAPKVTDLDRRNVLGKEGRLTGSILPAQLNKDGIPTQIGTLALQKS